jgi:hypothetical protein
MKARLRLLWAVPHTLETMPLTRSPKIHLVTGPRVTTRPVKRANR